MGNGALRRWALAALAPTLVLLSSFVHFVRSHRYPLWAPEVLLLCAAIAAAGAACGLVIALRERSAGPLVVAVLVAWFADMHFASLGIGALIAVGGAALLVGLALGPHLATVTTAVFGAVLLATLAVPPGPAPGQLSPAAAAPPGVERGPGAAAGGPRAAEGPPPALAAPAASRLPVVLHLILDEHIGLDGLPADLPQAQATKHRLAAFYESRGFYTFPRAFSQHFKTRYSLAHLFNFATRLDPGLVRPSPGRFEHEMARNAYLTSLQRRGYRPRVYQPTFVDLCPAPRSPGACYTYEPSTIRAIEHQPLSVAARSRIIASVYLRLSEIHRRVRGAYRALYRSAIGPLLPLPQWDWERGDLYALTAMSTIERLKRDLAGARPGDLFVAHVLMPHAPYLFDARCALRTDPGEWMARRLPGGGRGPRQTPHSRAARYEAYLQQVECVTTRVGELLDVLERRGLLDRAVVIVHGDHGSRIGLVEPVASRLGRMSPADFADAFSTLFAVKAPGIAPGHDPGPWSIVELLRELVAADFRSVPRHQRSGAAPPLYIQGDDPDTFVEQESRALPFGSR